jgi:hypothetical protein
MRHVTFESNPDIQLWPKLNMEKFGDGVIYGAACELGAVCGQDKLRFLDAVRVRVSKLEE